MRVLMLGWEFPPFIAGGLGTACYGLTRALDQRGVEILFVLPKAVDRAHSSHVHLISPDSPPPPAPSVGAPGEPGRPAGGEAPGRSQPGDASRSADNRSERRTETETYAVDEFEHVEFKSVPSSLASPYGDLSAMTEEERAAVLARREYERTRDIAREFEIRRDSPDDLFAQELGLFAESAARSGGGGGGGHGADYGGDLINDVRRYAAMCLELVNGQRFDVIHAHDWMTYPAGLAIARRSGRPLVAHIHSTEFDRSGAHVNQAVYEIERRGLHGAMRVIAVSFWTKNIVAHRYGVDESKIRVVWNGVDQPAGVSTESEAIASKDKIVLFLGRITMQKGPEYFVAAARRVLDKMDNVKFIVAGSGDMARHMIELAAGMGIGHKVLFTGFLRGADVARVYRMADLYVMPSVSEPFGIAPLEAMSHDVPVLISKQSGVSEALTHALKVDFWDVDEMANKILAVLRHPPLSHTLRQHGRFEVRRLTWEGAAEKCVRVYNEVLNEMAAARN